MKRRRRWAHGGLQRRLGATAERGTCWEAGGAGGRTRDRRRRWWIEHRLNLAVNFGDLGSKVGWKTGRSFVVVIMV
ncbi:hypothetical protein M0R45_037195 [Rubus argutus]|uniref:Uncharacterized protein n=1 Tax=Rubus argutus TaxID=59490 RepID=A0AAW1W1S5_RUBAR